MKNIYKGKKEKRKKGEIQTEIKVKQRSGDTDIDNIIEANEAEKIAKCYGARGKDKESELENKKKRRKTCYKIRERKQNKRSKHQRYK